MKSIVFPVTSRERNSASSAASRRILPTPPDMRKIELSHMSKVQQRLGPELLPGKENIQPAEYLAQNKQDQQEELSSSIAKTFSPLATILPINL